MWIGLANKQIFHQFAMFNILGTLYTKLYNQRIMADQQGLRLVTAISIGSIWTQNGNRRGTAMHKKK